MRSSDAEASAKIDAYIEDLPGWARTVCSEVRNCIHKASPSLSEAVKWNCPCFVGQRNVCGIMAFKKRVTLHFWNGALMSDGEGLFSQGGDDACGRGIDFFEGDKVPKTKLSKYVKEAAALDRGGAVPKMTRRRSGPIKVVIPPELAGAFRLKKHAKAKAFFDSLPPSARRDYCNWISDAKREATRQRRFERTLAQLAAGKRWYA